MIAKLITFSISVYQHIFSSNTGMLKFILPLPLSPCRFTPTCSQYFSLSIQKHGILKGTLTGIKRISKCNPFYPGGFDPVK